MNHQSILQQLDEGGIFAIFKLGPDKYVIREQCNKIYSLEFNRKHMAGLIEELTSLINNNV